MPSAVLRMDNQPCDDSPRAPARELYGFVLYSCSWVAFGMPSQWHLFYVAFPFLCCGPQHSECPRHFTNQKILSRHVSSVHYLFAPILHYCISLAYRSISFTQKTNPRYCTWLGISLLYNRCAVSNQSYLLTVKTNLFCLCRSCLSDIRLRA